MTQLDLHSPWMIAAVVAVIVILLLLIVWRKGRPFAAGRIFRASRLSSGNHLFPTQVQITPTAIVHHTPHWLGRSEHSIHIAHVASVRVDTGVLFSDVYIETSGGASPVRCHGHKKRDALEMQRLVEQFQSTYYRDQPSSPRPPVA
jgi:predicted small integral membrane protein